MQIAPPRQMMTIQALLVCLSLSAALLNGSGCHLPRWRHQEPAVLEIGATKEEIVTQINQNIVATETHPALESWRSGSVKLHADGIPIALPASVAVQAPRNFRLLVSNPLSGGQEADIGSNDERFWIWSKDNPQVLTSTHEDVGLALQELEMPIHIHPDWLMEVFGVIPLQANEFELKRPKVENGQVELIARRQSPLGEDVEKVIRVNVRQGRIAEHVLRLPGGKVLARARMDKYTRLPSGHDLPLLLTLEWPDAQMKMVIDVRNPEVNAESLISNTNIWKLPVNGEVIDIGAMARARKNSRTLPVSGTQVPPRHMSNPASYMMTTYEDLHRPEDSRPMPKTESATIPPIRAKVRLPDTNPQANSGSVAPAIAKPMIEQAGSFATVPASPPVQKASEPSPFAMPPDMPSGTTKPAEKTSPAPQVADDVPEWAR